jgi:hypothetical protein
MRRFCRLFFAQLRPGKPLNETEDDQREGRVVAISAATNSVLVPTTTLQPISNTGFNANGRLSLVRARFRMCHRPILRPSLRPQVLTRTSWRRSQSIRHAHSHVVSTGASPNGPQRFNVMAREWFRFMTPEQLKSGGQTDPTWRTAPSI